MHSETQHCTGSLIAVLVEVSLIIGDWTSKSYLLCELQGFSINSHRISLGCTCMYFSGLTERLSSGLWKRK